MILDAVAADVRLVHHDFACYEGVVDIDTLVTQLEKTTGYTLKATKSDDVVNGFVSARVTSFGWTWCGIETATPHTCVIVSIYGENAEPDGRGRKTKIRTPKINKSLSDTISKTVKSHDSKAR